MKPGAGALACAMTAQAIHYRAPVIIRIIILQRHVVAGLTPGAVKG
ncbi:ABC-type glycerol-3-phosphate transport system permease component [Arthrobacter sp. V4I6]|nr:MULTISPECIES: hypothetical protein [unclassified Arthrobacter]MDQ0820741.1 ABC-type glycerol-3-phosphate transport system permease component [Arthrobacter sp. V1I7]MDQ0855002.1 ABC-type glycerol-3-phosphate transport system permease component [Arthrobacter sp. V4I6]